MTRWSWLFFSITACGRVDIDPRGDSGTAGDQILFEDHFDGATIDPAWSLMRLGFVLQNGRLETTMTPRNGFNYGQGGNGRSGVAALHVGDSSWTDVRIEWTQQSLASVPLVDPTLLACEHTPVVFFRMEEYSESWNAPESTTYTWTIGQGCAGAVGPHGDWAFGSTYQSWIPGTGWSATQNGQGYSLATGHYPAIADAPVHFMIELHGTHIQIFVEGALVVDFDDTSSPHPPRFGGVGFSSLWEEMYWIDDVRVTALR